MGVRKVRQIVEAIGFGIQRKNEDVTGDVDAELQVLVSNAEILGSPGEADGFTVFGAG